MSKDPPPVVAANAVVIPAKATGLFTTADEWVAALTSVAVPMSGAIDSWSHLKGIATASPLVERSTTSAEVPDSVRLGTLGLIGTWVATVRLVTVKPEMALRTRAVEWRALRAAAVEISTSRLWVLT